MLSEVVELARRRRLAAEDVDEAEGAREALEGVVVQPQVHRLFAVKARVFLHLLVLHQRKRAGDLRGHVAGVAELRGDEAQFEVLHIELVMLGQRGHGLSGPIDVPLLVRDLLQPAAQLIHVVADLVGQIRPRLAHKRTVFAPARNALERERNQHANGNQRQVDERFLQRTDSPVRRVNLHGAAIMAILGAGTTKLTKTTKEIPLRSQPILRAHRPYSLCAR